jgi:hypothetical protein
MGSNNKRISYKFDNPVSGMKTFKPEIGKGK